MSASTAEIPAVDLDEAREPALRACLAVGQSSLRNNGGVRDHALVGWLMRSCTALAEAVARADSRSNGG